MIKKLNIDSAIKKENLIKVFFNEVPFGRYISDYKLDKAQSVCLEYNLLIKYLSVGEVYIAINEKNQIEGIIGFHFSEWDTKVFKKRMAIVKYFLLKEKDSYRDKKIAEKLIEIFHKWAVINNINVVVTKIESKYFTPVLVLQENGYIFYETNTIRTIDVDEVDKSKFKGISYRFANESDRMELKSLALKNTFKKAHYFLDNKFLKNRVEQMYTKWMENALNSEQRVLVIEDASKIIGVFIYENVDLTKYFNKKFGVWKFAAVDKNYRNRGLGQHLFNATMLSCIEDMNDIIDTDLVEKNIISQNFHDKLGFRLVTSLYTFHKWFN